MDHKRIALPGAKPGWHLYGHLRMINDKWARIRVDAEGPVHTSASGEQKRWRQMFGGSGCEEQARQFMQEHYGRDPFSGSIS